MPFVSLFVVVSNVCMFPCHLYEYDVCMYVCMYVLNLFMVNLCV
jgi:hypothetical protein